MISGAQVDSLASSMTTVLSVEHTKSKPKSSTPSTHSFFIRSPAGELLYALETESKHVQKVIKYNPDQMLARIEWRGNNKDLVQMGDNEPVSIDALWDPPRLGERYAEGFVGSDGEKYIWTKCVVGQGRDAYVEMKLTRSRSESLIAKHTAAIPSNSSQSISFSLPMKSKVETTSDPTSTLELFPGADDAGDMLYITFLVCFGRKYASTAFTLGGFFRNAVGTIAMNTIG